MGGERASKACAGRDDQIIIMGQRITQVQAKATGKARQADRLRLLWQHVHFIADTVPAPFLSISFETEDLAGPSTTTDRLPLP